MDTVHGSAQDITKALLDAGMTHAEISEALEFRVSARTIYRWAKGESVPQSKHDYDALVVLGARARTTPPPGWEPETHGHSEAEANAAVPPTVERDGA